MTKNNDKVVKNIIYFDENIKFEGNNIVNDICKIELELNCKVILVNDLNNFSLLLKYISKNKPKSKFAFIVNGSSADKVINFIKKNKYESFFIKACIYTRKKENYIKIKEKNPDFIELVVVKTKEVIKFINETFEKYKENNEQFNIETIINIHSYNNEYCLLHKQLSSFYGEVLEEKEILKYFPFIENIIKNEGIVNGKKDEIINCFKSLFLLKQKDYEKIIIIYLKNENYAELLNKLLKKKVLEIYVYLGYFTGNLMYSLVEYGKKKYKGVNNGKTLYKGMQLNVVDVLEFLKNRNYLITFPFFLSMTANKEFAELNSKRNNERNNKNKDRELYSCIMTIKYLYDEGYEPCVFNLEELAQYPDEEEYILLPFTFLLLKKINIDSNKLIVDIELEIIGKKEVLEYKIKDGKKIYYDEKQHIMAFK